MTRSLILALLASFGAALLAAPEAAGADAVAREGPGAAAVGGAVGGDLAAHGRGARFGPVGPGVVSPPAAVGPGVFSPPAAVDPGPRDRSRWQWPVRPRPPVLRPFRAPATTYGAGHRGLDLAASDGTQVLAVEGGVVTHSGVVAGRGTVTVSHPGGLLSTYEPVDPLVTEGAVVAAGDLLGTLRARDGPRHCGASACLHLGARRGGSYVDPYPLLTSGRLALLPLG